MPKEKKSFFLVSLSLVSSVKTIYIKVEARINVKYPDIWFHKTLRNLSRKFLIQTNQAIQKMKIYGRYII